MKKLILFITLLFIFIIQPLSSQEKPRFWDDVQTIKSYDKIYAPPAHPILFIGSSSIRRWDKLERTFANYAAMNRGLGGAVINDITACIDDIVVPYQPRQIVIYVGENELPNEQATADSIFSRTKRLIAAISTKLPETPIIYISIKPSPSREKYINKAIEANKLIKNYVATQKNIQFLDVFSLMLNREGKSDRSLFLEDMLHLNEKGYKIWQKAIKPLLLKE